MDWANDIAGPDERYQKNYGSGYNNVITSPLDKTTNISLQTYFAQRALLII